MASRQYAAARQTLMREVKVCPAELKYVEPDGTFEGYASLFGKADLGQDMVMPGAFAASLSARGATGIKLLFQHDPSEPIGVWLELREDAKGLFARGRLMAEVARAREVLSLMRAGALDGLSIGFRTVKARSDTKSGVRRIEQADLWEISIVTFPMLPEARVSTVKQRLDRGEVPSEREFERWLTRDAGFPRSRARALMRQGYKGLAGMRDASGGAQAEAHIARLLRRAARKINPERI